jgi:Cof subfamily protein (haloacid dehalogenase superfamily)
MAQTPDIRMVAVDLDGTLLDDAKRVPRLTAEAVAEAARRSARVVIASARPPRSVRAFYEQLGLDTLQVNYNGALIWDEPCRKAFYHQPIEGQVIRSIIRQAREQFPRVLVSCEILDRWYTDRFDGEFARQFGPQTARQFAPDVTAPVESFWELAATKLMLLGDDATILAPLKHMLAESYAHRVAVVHIDRGLLQIMDCRCSKAAAVAMVAQHYGVNLANVLAIGDAANDIPMLQECGHSVAMGNAPPAVQAVADWVAPGNNDDGVAAALGRYGLCAP